MNDNLFGNLLVRLRAAKSPSISRWTMGWIGVGWIAATAIGCAAGGNPTTAPTSQPTTRPAMLTFADSSGLIRLQYPGEFKSQPDPDYVLHATSGARTLTFDIPDLPPHVPKMIPLGLVVNGYKSDLKKSHPGIKIQEQPAPPVPQARDRELLSSWDENHVATTELAVLLVHGDHVFIIRIVAPGDQLASSRDVFDGIVGSIRFLK